MPTLYLIRHGQASFMQANYDVLSPLGLEQSETLGKYLLANQYQFDTCLTGTLNRHQGTYEGVKRIYEQAGQIIPNPLIIKGLDEHQAAEIHYQHFPKFLEESENQSIKEKIETVGYNHPSVKKDLLRLFFKGTKLWALGEIHAEGYESFAHFKTRVSQGFEDLMEIMNQHENVVAFTSGGTIGMLIGLVLGLSDEKIIELNWQVRNTSITEFSYSKGRFYLRGFNYIPHLQEDRLITYV